MKTILFQGDSITDAGRSRENDENMGVGYPTMVAGELGYENPGEYRFLNRGISGNRSVDLYARIKSDIICLKPDVMSILIGVNDVWHELDSGNGVDGDKYFMIYSLLLKEIKEALPLTKITGTICIKSICNRGELGCFSGRSRNKSRKGQTGGRRISTAICFASEKI